MTSKYHAAQPGSIQQLFATIASHYDRSNAIVSLGLFRYWNTKFVRRVLDPKHNHVLDLCAGTGEIAFEILKKTSAPIKCTLADFCPEMLTVAKKRAQALEKRGLISNKQLEFIQADAMDLPFADANFDLLTIAYGIRNVQDPSVVFAQCARVLKPGGRLAILELTRPKHPVFLFVYSIYLYCLMPVLSFLTAFKWSEYRYLATSIHKFSSPDDLSIELKNQGFESIELHPLMGGILTIISAQKAAY